MADRVKYFLLGLLFLVVAGVIAYDRWNTEPTEAADRGDDRGWEVVVGPTQETPPAGVSVPPALAPDPEPAKPVKKETKETPQPTKTTRAPIVLERPQPKPPVVEVKPPPAKVHIIRAGETLESISLKYYKTRKGIQWIVEANKLKDPDRVYENQKLVIPARKVIQPQGTSTTKKAEPRATKTRAKLPANGRYTVRPGDGDLYAICRRFYGAQGEGARVARIMELNKLWSAEVKAGTVLILPKD